jgi:flagellar protein FlaJ
MVAASASATESKAATVPVAPMKRMPEIDEETMDLVKEFQDQLREGQVDLKQIVYILVAVGVMISILMGVLLAAGTITMGRIAAIDMIVIAMLIAIGPIGFIVNAEQRRVRNIEERLPDFLRDVAEAGRFGMTLSNAIVASSKGEYGKLTPEIRRMASQISWGVSATEALVLFTKRVNTPLVHRVGGLIIKSSAAGGNIADVLTMSSVDTKESQNLFAERRSNMSTYIMVIYIAFFVFLVTVLILNKTFLPRMEAVTKSQGLSDMDLSGAPTAGVATISADMIPKIRNIFFYAALVHAVGDGILAGVMDNGKIANGLRHSFIMVFIAYIFMRFLAG